MFATSAFEEIRRTPERPPPRWKVKLLTTSDERKKRKKERRRRERERERERPRERPSVV